MKLIAVLVVVGLAACKNQQPPQEQRPKPMTGNSTLTVRAVDGCMVMLDGNDAGVTPLVIKEPPLGPHQVEVRCPGSKPKKVSVIIDSTLDQRVTIEPQTLEPATP